MKKVVMFLLIMITISSSALADGMLSIMPNSMQLAMLDEDTYKDTDEDNTDVVIEPNTNSSTDEDRINIDPNENDNEDNTEPVGDNQEDNMNPDKGKPTGTEEPVPEISDPPDTKVETEPPVEPENKVPSKPASNIINTLNKENAWSNKTVYFTFDDGPSSITTKVLDLLKKENIKATFFVIGTKTDEGKTLLKRISDEGHAIGNHTYSHNYNYIYKSVDNFFEDLYKNENIVYEATKKRPKIIRFPGGSNNASTKTEKGKKIINEIMNRLEKEGYVHFDWNASSGDASAVPASVDEIINNTLTWVSRNNTAVVLFHDTAAKTNTLKALPTIIEKLKFLGCKFEVLTTNSPHIAFVKNSNNTNTDTIPANAKNKDRKPPHVIKKLMRLEEEMEKRFIGNGH
ncbi:polysaccharide deacetylase family protein [Proteiniborus sp. MB09-C3]|uniref:polysaccharide deacetylase family protein n=1 Tax=Proteiniborus sp. MB09-C3 TaxID=3050072 RepID=UPI0025527849|nr:polysaccharide deacetylase family protein [Proteiniborus sp. MB09-C3]WIV12541.1 polysaccharide deacetylase family protein [Proteiniborus sp. MB09-C3]